MSVQSERNIHTHVKCNATKRRGKRSPDWKNITNSQERNHPYALLCIIPRSESAFQRMYSMGKRQEVTLKGEIRRISQQMMKLQVPQKLCRRHRGISQHLVSMGEMVQNMSFAEKQEKCLSFLQCHPHIESESPIPHLQNWGKNTH